MTAGASSSATDIRLFIQARMTSARFPGKVLAPFHGRPMIAAVVDRVSRAVPVDRIVLATSDGPSDDPLATYASSLGVVVFRGHLDDVCLRFQRCLEAHPCAWFYRVSADSPLIDHQLLLRAAELRAEGVDLVTNVFPRTFPKGQSVELLRAATFAAIDPRTLNAHQREHATAVYYQHPERFGIRNFEAEMAGGADVAVDTVEDLRRVIAAAGVAV